MWLWVPNTVSSKRSKLRYLLYSLQWSRGSSNFDRSIGRDSNAGGSIVENTVHSGHFCSLSLEEISRVFIFGRDKQGFKLNKCLASFGVILLLILHAQ